MSVLRVEGLSKAFGNKVVLNCVNFELQENDSFVVLGGSGVGKSVLIKCIIGLIKPDAGNIWLHGENISKLSNNAKRHLSIGMLFQNGALFDSMSVIDNICFGLVNGLQMPLSKARAIGYEKLLAVDLTESVGALYPASLSGGMQKRVALARALAMNPSILFFDEPTTGLDPIVSSTINDLIIKTIKHSSAITITHDLKSMRAIGKHVGFLSSGKFLWQGAIKDIELCRNEEILKFLHA